MSRAIRVVSRPQMPVTRLAAPRWRQARPTTSRLWPAAALAMLASPLLAQEPVTERGTVVRSEDHLMVAPARSALMPQLGQVGLIAGAGSVMGEVVEGKPYSAEAITEFVQVLADGNRIVNSSRTRVYRDSDGRTRREQFLGRGGAATDNGDELTVIVIDDPVGNVSYVLDQSARAARQLRPLQLSAGTVPRPEGFPGAGGMPGNVVIARRVMRTAEDGVESSSEVEMLASPATPPVPFEFGLSAPAFAVGPTVNIRMLAPPTATSTEDLGEQVLEGVLAEGTRETQIIPAGQIGNERPIEIVAERWYSPELEAIVLRRTSDPRFGETSYRLINVDRSEPPPELFTVPQDYRLEAEPSLGAEGRP